MIVSIKQGIVGICEPIEDGYRVECTTQWIDSTQRAVANVLGINNSSCIDIQVKQLGGGFGGKLTRGNFAATAAAVAANSLNLPVKVLMDLNDCMVFYFIVFQTVF
jgi:xanthine dehydrogenase molybdopterin-binding subunit B